MKKLRFVSLHAINPNKKYFYFKEEYNRFGGGPLDFYIATGQQIINDLRKLYEYDEWVLDLPKRDATLKKFLKYADDANGDGSDYVLVMDIPQSK